MEWLKEETRRVQHMIDIANAVFCALFFPGLIIATIIIPLIVRFS